MPKISVIVPIYNVEKYIHRCIDSILAQTFTDFELILVDDGSPDNCPEICDEYAAKDDRIRVIHKPNGGVSSARNAGLESAQGEYITFCDGDDYYLPAQLSDYIGAIGENDMVLSGFERVDENDTIQRVAKRRTGVWNIAAPESKLEYLIFNVLYHGNGWEVCLGLFKAEIIKHNNIRFCLTCENFAEDLCFTLEYLLYSDSVAAIASCNYHYVQHEDSMMQKSKNAVRLNPLNEVAIQFGGRFLKLFPQYEEQYAVLYYLIMQNQYVKLYFNRETCRKIKHDKLRIADIAYHDYWMKKAQKQYALFARIYGKHEACYQMERIRFLLTGNPFRVILYGRVLRFLRWGKRICRKFLSSFRSTR